MVTVRPNKKDIDFDYFDYVFEDSKELEEVLPYLLPKLDGEWTVLLLEPKLEKAKLYIETTFIPSYINLSLALEETQLKQIYLENPKLVEQEKSPWDIYLDLISKSGLIMADSVLKEIYYRCGPKEKDLAEALKTLSQYDIITMREVNKHFLKQQRVYASAVVKQLLAGHQRQALRLFAALELEQGTTRAFYYMRKAIRNLLEQKTLYLQNQDVKSKSIADLSTYDIVRLYWLFETATSPQQLDVIIQMYERSTLPCSL